MDVEYAHPTDMFGDEILTRIRRQYRTNTHRYELTIHITPGSIGDDLGRYQIKGWMERPDESGLPGPLVWVEYKVTLTRRSAEKKAQRMLMTADMHVGAWARGAR